LFRAFHDANVQSTSMIRGTAFLCLSSVSLVAATPQQAAANDYNNPPAVIYATSQTAQPVRLASATRSNMGGGFIEFVFGDSDDAQPRSRYEQQPDYYKSRRQYLPPMSQEPTPQPGAAPDYANQQLDPKYERQLVAYQGGEKAGTIVIDTPNKFLYLVQQDGTALRYGVGVGRPGFTWSGVKSVTAKREWPAWTPPAEMLARRPDLPRYMAGGPDNPLGARAMYLGSTLYRIHGSNEPWTIGTNVSSGCIRMRNEDVIDLYGRVGVGAKVVVI
jgi:lipoprotein-anchoring transpeptidase ErfK/SrfK